MIFWKFEKWPKFAKNRHFWSFFKKSLLMTKSFVISALMHIIFWNFGKGFKTPWSFYIGMHPIHLSDNTPTITGLIGIFRFPKKCVSDFRETERIRTSVKNCTRTPTGSDGKSTVSEKIVNLYPVTHCRSSVQWLINFQNNVFVVYYRWFIHFKGYFGRGIEISNLGNILSSTVLEESPILYTMTHRLYHITYMTSSFIKNITFHAFYKWFVVKGGYFDRRSHLEALEKWIYFHFGFKCRTQKMYD